MRGRNEKPNIMGAYNNGNWGVGDLSYCILYSPRFVASLGLVFMTETPAVYLVDPLTPDQSRKLAKLLRIIRDEGGFGKIEIEVKDSKIKFINLKEVRGLVE